MKKRYILLEISIWLIISSLIIWGGYSSIYTFLNQRQVYNATFKDIDSLMIGSPVRVMGIHVGYILSIKPIYDEVNLQFVITNPDVKIPKGTLASVQFSGLAGSRSLELIPAKFKYKGPKEFISIEPIRIHSLYEVQNKVLESSISYSQNLLNFYGDNSPEELKNNIKDVVNKTNAISLQLEDTTQILEKTNKEIVLDLNYTKNHFNNALNILDKIKNPFNQKFFKINKIKTIDISTKTLTNLSNNTATINKDVHSLNKKVEKIKLENKFIFLNNISQKITKFAKSIQNFVKKTQS